MANEHPDKLTFEDCKITIVIGDGIWEWAGGKGATRAVVELSKEDLSPVMPRVSGLIDGCGYSQEANLMGFNYRGRAVIVESRRITINDVEDEATARSIIDWLLNKINGTDQGVIEREVS